MCDKSQQSSDYSKFQRKTKLRNGSKIVIICLFIFHLVREWILMHLKKRKIMKPRMLMETRKKQSFCEEHIQEASVAFDRMRRLDLDTPPENWLQIYLLFQQPLSR